jgi:hypothetical protein
MQGALYGFVRTVLGNLMGHVALTAILRKITTDHQGGGPAVTRLVSAVLASG